MKTRTLVLATSACALVGAGYWLGSSASEPAPVAAPLARAATIPVVATSRAPVPMLPSSTHAPDLVSDLRDTDPKVRRAALREVTLDRDVDVQLLLEASRDGDLEVSAIATVALGKAYAEGRVEAGELVARVQDTSLDVKVRSAALTGLGVVASPEAAALLAGIAASGAPDDRASAVILLRNQDMALAVPTLITALGDAEPRVRELARDSLKARSRGRDFGEDRAAWQAWWTSRR